MTDKNAATRSCSTAFLQPNDPKKARMLEQIQSDAPSKLGLFRRLYASKNAHSRALAIKCQCLQCCWMSEAAIRECTDTACPLWTFRPYQPGRRRRPASSTVKAPAEAVPFPHGAQNGGFTTRQGARLENAMRGDDPPQSDQTSVDNRLLAGRAP